MLEDVGQDNRATFSALLAEPDEDDTSRLRKPYADRPPFCLDFHDRRADDALLVVHARMRDIILIADKLPCWGFSYFDRVLLLHRPQKPDVAEAKVLALSKWGKAQFPMPDDWPSSSDTLSVVDSLVHGVGGRKIHLFAKGARDGWETVVGKANWATETSADD
jgi:N6-adenosine-specific RNA methylase IME4